MRRAFGSVTSTSIDAATHGGGVAQQRMTAAGGIVVGQREIETAVLVEVDQLHAVRGVVLQDEVRQRFGERRRAVDEQGVAIERLPGDEVADVEIGQAVVVEIAPRRGDAVAREVDAAIARHVGEPLPGLIAIQRAGTVIGDEQIEVAIQVEVGEARADAAVFLRPRHAGDAERGATSSNVPAACRNRPLASPSWFAVNRSRSPSRSKSHHTALTVLRESPMPDARHVDEAAAIVPQQAIGDVAKRREQIEIAVAVVVDPGRLAATRPSE